MRPPLRGPRPRAGAALLTRTRTRTRTLTLTRTLSLTLSLAEQAGVYYHCDQLIKGMYSEYMPEWQAWLGLEP